MSAGGNQIEYGKNQPEVKFLNESFMLEGFL